MTSLRLASRVLLIALTLFITGCGSGPCGDYEKPGTGKAPFSCASELKRFDYNRAQLSEAEFGALMEYTTGSVDLSRYLWASDKASWSQSRQTELDSLERNLNSALAKLAPLPAGSIEELSSNPRAFSTR